MDVPIDLYALAFLSALGITALAVPVWTRWCQATRHVDAPGDRKIHFVPIPLAGGLAVMTGFFLPWLLGYIWLQVMADASDGMLARVAYGFSQRLGQLGVILGGAAGMVLLGWLDDRHDLAPQWKLAGQVAMAGLVAWSGIRISLFVPSQAVSYALTILWIVTLINAFNFMDNMNGLCAGLGAIATWACAWNAVTQGQYLVALLGFQICGALVGFLPFNFPRASVFLGDAGSHLVGYLVAILAILPDFYSARTPNPLAVLSPVLIVLVPLVDLVAVTLRRWRNGKPLYVGDTNHLSHRLVRSGMSQRQAVLLLWLATALAAGFAILIVQRGGGTTW